MSQEKREWLNYIAILRRLARSARRQIDKVSDEIRQERRRARKYRASGKPILVRRAEVIEAKIAERKHSYRDWEEVLCHIGCEIRTSEGEINRLIPQGELLDLLEVNPADRCRVTPSDGITEIVFLRGLEDSATNRGCDFKEGPLAQAIIRYMGRMLETNEKLQKTVLDGLFGKGGMFEFLPTYQRTPAGDFVRNPPKLRLADACDAKGAA